MSHTLARTEAGPSHASLPAHLRGLFFIVGSPRSGTTLLRTMLAAHPDVCIPHETEFFMRVPPSRGSKLRQAVEAYIRSGPFANQELDGASLAARVAGGTLPTRGATFVELMSRHARRSGKSMIGEKSPHHCRHVEAIAAEIPESRFIHIVRDPRDVVASWLGMPWSSRSTAAGARGWADIAREHRRLLATMPANRYTEVRFETLLQSPEAELRRLSAFLGMEFHPDMLRFHERAEAGRRRSDPTFAGVSDKPLEADAVGRHRTRIGDRELATIQRYAGAEMQRAGYSLVPTPRRLSWMLGDAAGRILDRFSVFERSCRKRLGLNHAGPASMAWERPTIPRPAAGSRPQLHSGQ